MIKSSPKYNDFLEKTPVTAAAAAAAATAKSSFLLTLQKLILH